MDGLRGKSFQEHFVRLPIRLRGFGLRSMVDTSQAAFIGGVEMALGGEEAEEGWWQSLLESGSKTGQEYGASWRLLQTEGEQLSTFLNLELNGALSSGPATVGSVREGGSSRQLVTEQREEMREAVLAEALRRYEDQAARPVQFSALVCVRKLLRILYTAGSERISWS